MHWGCGWNARGTPGERTGTWGTMALTSSERKRRWRERRRAMLAAPSVVRKAADPSVPDADLDGFTLAVRQARAQIVAQNFGGLDRLTVVDAWKVDAATERWIVREHLGKDVLRLAREGKLANLDPKARRVHPILEAWLRVMDGFERALERLGSGQAGPGDDIDQALRKIRARVEQARAAAPTKPVSSHGGAQAEIVPVQPSEPVQAPRGPERSDDAPVSRGPRQAPEPPEPLEVRPASLVPGVPQDGDSAIVGDF